MHVGDGDKHCLLRRRSSTEDDELPLDALSEEEEEQALQASLPGIQRSSKAGAAITGHPLLRLYSLCARLEVYASHQTWASLTR